MNGTPSKDKDKYFILSIENNLLSAEKLFELPGALIWEIINFWHLLGSCFSASFPAKANDPVLFWAGLWAGVPWQWVQSVPGPAWCSPLGHPELQPALLGSLPPSWASLPIPEICFGAWLPIYQLRHSSLDIFTWAFSVVGVHPRKKQQPFVLNNLFLRVRSREKFDLWRCRIFH